MDPRTDQYKYRRKPWLAGFLSFFLPGLGLIYCGRFTRGLIFALIFSFIIPALFILLAFTSSLLQNHYVLLMASVSVLLFLVWFLAIIVSVRVAKKTELIYTLKKYNRWYVYLILFLFFSFGFSGGQELILSKIVERWTMSNVSMCPTLRIGDRFLVNNIIYNKSLPQIGDIVIFPYPEEPRNLFVQRIVALGGDTVQIKDNRLYVNQQKIELEEISPAIVVDYFGEFEGKIYLEKNGASQYNLFITEDSAKKAPRNYPPKEIPQEYCFVLGDNRSISLDSSVFGPIPLSSIKGKADYIYFPAEDWSRFGKLNKK